MTDIIKFVKAQKASGLESPEILKLVFQKYDKNSGVFERIQEKLDDTTIEDMLKTHIDSLIQTFSLKEEAHENHFKAIRDSFRKADISERGKIEVISAESIKDFKWDQICQLFEQEVVKDDTNLPTSAKIYKYIEESTIDGESLLVMAKEMKEALKLTPGENIRLDILMKKLQPPGSKEPSVLVSGRAMVGAIATGDGISNFENINVGNQYLVEQATNKKRTNQ